MSKIKEFKTGGVYNNRDPIILGERCAKEMVVYEDAGRRFAKIIKALFKEKNNGENKT